MYEVRAFLGHHAPTVAVAIIFVAITATWLRRNLKMAALLRQRYNVEPTLTLSGLKVPKAARSVVPGLDAAMSAFENRERVMNIISVLGAGAFLFTFPTLLKYIGLT